MDENNFCGTVTFYECDLCKQQTKLKDVSMLIYTSSPQLKKTSANFTVEKLIICKNCEEKFVKWVNKQQKACCRK